MEQDWQGWALLVVDVQPKFVAAVSTACPDFAARIERLLAWARTHVQVVHVRAHYSADKSRWLPAFRDWRGLEASSTFGEVEPAASDFAVAVGAELVVIKHTFDGFFETELESVLRAMSVQRVLVCGLVTSCCIFATAQAATFRGFGALLIEDCCADRSLADHHDALRIGQHRAFALTRFADLTTVDHPNHLPLVPLLQRFS